MKRSLRDSLVYACGAIVLLGPAASLRAQPKAPVVERVQYARVVATDYTFDAPAKMTEGIVAFHLVNDGPDVHQLSIIELGVGHTLKDFFDGMRAKGQPPVWTVEVGMTPTIQPRTEAFLTVRLHPGRYILSCLIAARDGRSHVEKGMSMQITVTPRAPARGGD